MYYRFPRPYEQIVPTRPTAPLIGLSLSCCLTDYYYMTQLFGNIEIEALFCSCHRAMPLSEIYERYKKYYWHDLDVDFNWLSSFMSSHPIIWKEDYEGSINIAHGNWLYDIDGLINGYRETDTILIPQFKKILESLQ